MPRISLFAACLLGVYGAQVFAGEEARRWSFDATAYSQRVTDCDLLAAHPDDPDRVTGGVGQAAMDLVQAIEVCRSDLADDPDNPRLLYQLARALTYAGEIAEGLPLLERASAANYPQALFVEGYLYLTGLYGAPENACRAGELMRQSALYGRLAGQIGFPAYVLKQRFEGCAVDQSPEALLAMLESAQSSQLDFYAGLLVSVLMEALRNDTRGDHEKAPGSH